MFLIFPDEKATIKERLEGNRQEKRESLERTPSTSDRKQHARLVDSWLSIIAVIGRGFGWTWFLNVLRKCNYNLKRQHSNKDPEPNTIQLNQNCSFIFSLSCS
jgi:hypothetical protein